MSKEVQVSIVIPIFNEEESIPQLVEEILITMRRSNYSFEIVLVNDGSKDS